VQAGQIISDGIFSSAILADINRHRFSFARAFEATLTVEIDGVFTCDKHVDESSGGAPSAVV